MKRFLLAGAAFSALSAFPALPAHAQNVAPVGDDEGDVITVTAQKREQAISEVPLAISAFSQDELDALVIQQFDDLADFVPGLEVQEQSANNPGFVIRGITSDSGEATIEPAVAIFQDGVPISRSRGSFVEVFDSRVEVVRGPQPTLFGRSALIGAISLVSNRPEIGETSAQLRAGGGNFGHSLVDGYVNYPLGDIAAVRVSGRYKKRDGYIENLLGEDLNGYELGAGRVSVQVEPTEDFTAYFAAFRQQDSNPGTSFKSGTFLPVGPDGQVGVIDPSEPAALSSFGDLEGGRDLGLERTVNSLTLLLDWEFAEGFTLSSVTNYRDFDSSEVFDADGFGLPLFNFAENAQGEQVFQEIRLGFEGISRLSGFVGASYYNEEGSQNVPLSYDERVAQALLGGFLFTAPPGTVQTPPPLAALPTVNADPASPLFGTPLGNFTEEFTNFADVTSYDLFADATLEVTDRLDLTAGVRWTYDDKRSGYSANADGVSALTGAGIFVGAQIFNGGQPVFAEDEFDGVTWRLAAAYELTDSVNAYATYGRGRRPQLLAYQTDTSLPGVVEENFTTVDAEKTDSFEIGAKGTLFDDRLTFDLAAYWYEYTDFQTTAPDGVRIVPINGGNASGGGFETSLSYDIAESVSVFGNYAYNGVTFDDETDDGTPIARAGNRFRLSPENAALIGLRASHGFGFGDVTFIPTYNWRSEMFFDDDNDRPELQAGNAIPDTVEGDEIEDGYGLLDLRLTVEPRALENVTLQLFVENLTDEEYLLDAGNTGDLFSIPTFIAGPPRLYGGYVTVSF